MWSCSDYRVNFVLGGRGLSSGQPAGKYSLVICPPFASAGDAGVVQVVFKRTGTSCFLNVVLVGDTAVSGICQRKIVPAIAPVVGIIQGDGLNPIIRLLAAILVTLAPQLYGCSVGGVDLVQRKLCLAVRIQPMLGNRNTVSGVGHIHSTTFTTGKVGHFVIINSLVVLRIIDQSFTGSSFKRVILLCVGKCTPQQVDRALAKCITVGLFCLYNTVERTAKQLSAARIMAFRCRETEMNLTRVVCFQRANLFKRVCCGIPLCKLEGCTGKCDQIIVGIHLVQVKLAEPDGSRRIIIHNMSIDPFLFQTGEVCMVFNGYLRRGRIRDLIGVFQHTSQFIRDGDGHGVAGAVVGYRKPVMTDLICMVCNNVAGGSIKGHTIQMDRAQIQLSRGVGRGIKAKRIRQGQGVAGGQQFSAGGVDNNAVVDLLGRSWFTVGIETFIDDSAGLIKLFIAAFDGGFRFCLIAVPFCAVAVLVFRTKIVPRSVLRNADRVADIENLRFSRNVVAVIDRKRDRTVGVGCANMIFRYTKVCGCRNIIV